jgi:hypothetical protein
MKTHGLITRCISLITSMAILIASIVMPASHAHSQPNHTVAFSFWTEVCTSEGMKVLKVEGNRVVPSSHLDGKTSSLHHCTFCYAYSNGFNVPHTGGFILPVLGGASSFPLLFYRSHQPLFAWSSAQPRAPPSHF